MNALFEGGVIQKVTTSESARFSDSLLLSGYTYGHGSWTVAVFLKEKVAGIAQLPKGGKPKAAQKPNPFVMLLRKYIVGKKILTSYAFSEERIVVVPFTNGLALVFELMPRIGNVKLVENLDPKDLSGSNILGAYRRSRETEGTPVSLPDKQVYAVKKIREFSDQEGETYWQRCSNFLLASLNVNEVEEEIRRLQGVLQASLKKDKKAANKFQAEMHKASERLGIKVLADVLSAQLHELGPKKLPKQESIQVPHYESGELMQIPLDKRYSFSENANRLYEKVKKLGRTEKEVSARLLALTKRIETEENLLKILKSAKSIAEVGNIEKEMISLRLLKANKVTATGKRAVKKKQVAKPYLELISSDGFIILIGRSKEENRRVTFKSSSPWDTWLHVKGFPGSHGIIKGVKTKSVPLSTLLEASQLVAYYSKVKSGAKVEVDYALKKYVRSQKGTVAEVTYTDYKTIYIDVRHEVVRALLQNNNV